VTDESHLARFLVRRGATRDWMVWDRHTKGPAKYLGNPAVELPEDHAREIAGELTKRYIPEGVPAAARWPPVRYSGWGWESAGRRGNASTAARHHLVTTIFAKTPIFWLGRFCLVLIA
jgi:hypothetical protein